jgi:hypothetical protein
VSSSAVTIVVAVVLTLHGLIHLLAVAKAFGYTELAQLTQPISRAMGAVWLAASILVVAAAATLVARPRATWMVGAAALVVSQAAILWTWPDAWAGTIVNVLLLMVVAHGWFTEGPRSFRARFDRDVAAGLAHQSPATVVTEQDLVRLPPPVGRYLRALGVVGRPRIRSYQLRFTGRIRSAPDSPWMPFEADQHSFTDPPTRLFLMRATMSGLPVAVFHHLAGGHATMQVKLAGVIPIVDASGPEMDRSETVTLLNDMSLLAPATLIDPHVAWDEVSDRIVRACFTHGAHTIVATLEFGDDGRLVNFVSDDRSRASSDGRSFTRLRFSTPVRDYRDFGAIRLAAHGEARWQLPEGEFTYGEFDIEDIAYNDEPGGGQKP